jgi:hypothetical protein
MTTFHTSISGLCAFALARENDKGQRPLVQVLCTHGSSANMTPHEPFLAVPEKNVISGCLPDFVLGSSADAYAVWRLQGFRLRYPPPDPINPTLVDWMVKGLFNLSTDATPDSDNLMPNRDTLSVVGTVAGFVELCSGKVTEGERVKPPIAIKYVKYEDLDKNQPLANLETHPPLSIVHTLERDEPLILELIPLNHSQGTGRLIAIAPEMILEKDGKRKKAEKVELQISNYQHPEPPLTDSRLALWHFIAHYDFLKSPPVAWKRFFPVMVETSRGFTMNRPTGANCFRGPLMAELSGTVETVGHVHAHETDRPTQTTVAGLPSI